MDLALAFLKKHYRNQPHWGSTQLKKDVRTDDGIIADGYLAFRTTEEGDTFTATIESTDYFSREELRYAWDWELLVIDGIASSLGNLAIWCGWIHIRGHPSVYPAGPWIAIFALVGTLILGVGLWVLVFRHRSRYHYIYAIEQFKKYFANDQWVAFAWDVFAGANDKYYLELRKQCIRHGFGLLEIDRDQHIKMHLAPAKEDLFGHRRRVQQFMITGMWSARIRQEFSKRMPFTNRKTGWSIPELDWNRLFRFRRSYRHQGFISLVSLLLIGFFFSLELRERPIVFADQPADLRKREKQARQWQRSPTPESKVFIVDSLAVPPPMPNVEPYLSFSARELDPVALGPPKGEVYLMVDQQFQAFPCRRIQEAAAGRYLVYLDSYAEVEYAKSRALLLRNQDIRVNIIWADCFFPGRYFF